MGGVWARLRAEVRGALVRTATLILLIGVAAGVVIGAAAGARRTQTAYPRFLRDSHSRGFLVSVANTGLKGFYDKIGQLPEVDRMAPVAGVPLYRIDANGRAILSVQTVAATDARFGSTVQRPNLLSGRLPNPDRATEAFANRNFAVRYHLTVGSTIAMRAFRGDPADPLHVGPDEGTPVTLTIVGIGVTATGVVPVAVDDNLPGMVLTPAYFHRYADPNHLDFDGAFVELRPGADTEAFRRGVDRLAAAHPEVGSVFLASFAEHAGKVQRAILPQAVALWLFALLAGLGSLLAIGQIVSRQVFLHTTEYPILRALGMDRRQLLGIQLLRVGVAAAIGAAIGVGLAVATSGFMPIGPARLAEPGPGISVNAAILSLGFAATVLLLLGAAAVPAWRATSSHGWGGVLGPAQAERPSRVAAWAARVGFPASAWTGVRMALEPGRGRTSVPVRSAVAGLGVAIAATAAAFTFGTNLTRLVSTPGAYGWSWDLMADAQFGSFSRQDAAEILDRFPDVAAYAGGTYGTVLVEGKAVPAIGIDPLRGRVFPTLIEGRPPAGPGEMVLGTATLASIHRSVGDTVRVVVNGSHRTLRVVGRSVFPTFGQGSFTPTDLGEGAAVSASTLPTQYIPPGTPPGSSYNFVLIRYAAAADPDRLTAQLKAAIGQRCPLDQYCTIRQAEPPVDVAGYGHVRATPLLLAGLLGLLAVGMMAHALVTSVRRRRRDLAILKTLGFLNGQVSSTVAWQATTLTVVGLLLGLPAGIGAGRWTWSLFAEKLGVEANPLVPLFWLLVGIPATILLANLVAALPGRAAARTKPSAILRTE